VFLKVLHGEVCGVDLEFSTLLKVGCDPIGRCPKVKDEPEEARYQWLMPVILVSWEAEIGNIIIIDQPRQIVPETSS
jgi:hypothetical protein